MDDAAHLFYNEGCAFDCQPFLTEGLKLSSIPRTMWARPKPTTPAPSFPLRALAPKVDTTAPRPAIVQLVVVALFFI